MRGLLSWYFVSISHILMFNSISVFGNSMLNTNSSWGALHFYFYSLEAATHDFIYRDQRGKKYYRRKNTPFERFCIWFELSIVGFGYIQMLRFRFLRAYLYNYFSFHFKRRNDRVACKVGLYVVTCQKCGPTLLSSALNSDTRTRTEYICTRSRRVVQRVFVSHLSLALFLILRVDSGHISTYAKA